MKAKKDKFPWNVVWVDKYGDREIWTVNMPGRNDEIELSRHRTLKKAKLEAKRQKARLDREYPTDPSDDF